MSAERWRGVPLDLYLENEGEVVVFDPVSWRTHLLSHFAFGLVRHLRSHPASIDELLNDEWHHGPAFARLGRREAA